MDLGCGKLLDGIRVWLTKVLKELVQDEEDVDLPSVGLVPLVTRCFRG